jgi:hypothetical protein
MKLCVGIILPALGFELSVVGNQKIPIETNLVDVSFPRVMAGLVPAIHVFGVSLNKTWMPGTRPGMTTE